MSEAEGAILTERQHYWLGHVQACEVSGKIIAEYASEHGITAQAMYAGKKMLVKKGELPRTRRKRFQRAQVVGPVVVGEWHTQLPNGLSVTFTGSAVDADALSTVLSAAATLE